MLLFDFVLYTASNYHNNQIPNVKRYGRVERFLVIVSGRSSCLSEFKSHIVLETVDIMENRKITVQVYNME